MSAELDLISEQDATISTLRAEVERLTEERQRENWWPPMERVMQRYPGFDWGDYQDGISEDDAANFFEADLQECWALVKKEKARAEKLEAALTPSLETKAALMGEFSMQLPGVDEDGEEYMRNINVPWTTIKEVMAAIRALATSSTTQPEKPTEG